MQLTTGKESTVSDGQGTMLRLGQLVYVEVYDVKAGGYVRVHSLVVGKWRLAASSRDPWHVAAELKCDVADGSVYRAEDVVVAPPFMVWTTNSDGPVRSGSGLGQGAVAALVEVRVKDHRVIERGEAV